VLATTDAMAGLLLLHVPPAIELEKVYVLPKHRLLLPEISPAYKVITIRLYE
jgi:hypothetical protein